jgi:hypothetical protein
VSIGSLVICIGERKLESFQEECAARVRLVAIGSLASGGGGTILQPSSSEPGLTETSTTRVAVPVDAYARHGYLLLSLQLSLAQ